MQALQKQMTSNTIAHLKFTQTFSTLRLKVKINLSTKDKAMHK